jgi:hypothetical protein
MQNVGKIEPRSGVFPSRQVPAIIMHESKMRQGLLTWDLIPLSLGIQVEKSGGITDPSQTTPFS